MSETPLQSIIRHQIAASGPMTVHDFMAICLQHPEHGYYRNADAIGQNGDFTTAPEISQLFGELIGIWCLVVWQQLGESDKLNLIELGPGRGTLMADLLRVGKLRPGFLEALSLTLVETNRALRNQQEKAVADTGIKPVWCENLSDIAVTGSPTIVIANEFLDALPVRQFVHKAGDWYERTVVNAAPDTETAFAYAHASEPTPLVSPSNGAADGAILEIRPEIPAALAELKRIAGTAPLAALFIDYGYAEPTTGETLQAVSNHVPVPIFHAPGQTDLTAHVDFASLSNAASGLDMTVHPLLNQAQFLGQLGIIERLQQLTKEASAENLAREQTAAARLISPDAMGSLFKVMAISTNGLETLPVFEVSA